jgi:DNA end-binding protein Ku
MPPRPLWSGNLRLSLVVIPVQLHPATTSERAVSFRQIHKPSGKPINYRKVIESDDGFEEVPEEEIVKGYEFAKGSHVLLDPEEIDELKLEAKQTIDLVRFVDADAIDERYYERPYYIAPDGEVAEEGFAVLRDALEKSKKIAVGQLILHGKGNIVAIRPCGKGLLLEILRHEHELRPLDGIFDHLGEVKVDASAVKMARDLVKRETDKFEPEKFKDDYNDAIWELIAAKREKRAPEVEIDAPERAPADVINIMDALKKSMRSKVGAGAGKRMGGPKRAAKKPRSSRGTSKPGARPRS